MYSAYSIGMLEAQAKEALDRASRIEVEKAERNAHYDKDIKTNREFAEKVMADVRAMRATNANEDYIKNTKPPATEQGFTSTKEETQRSHALRDEMTEKYPAAQGKDWPESKDVEAHRDTYKPDAERE